MDLARLFERFVFSTLFSVSLLFLGCEDEEVANNTQTSATNNNQAYFVARAGKDRSIMTGDTVVLKASFAENQRNNTFSWRFVELPEGSQATIQDSQLPVVSFLADEPGIYKLELGMYLDQFSSFDTVSISAFTVTELQGEYQSPAQGANGLIRQFLTFKDKLFAVGDFNEIGGVKALGIASFDGTRWQDAGDELQMDQVYQLIQFRDNLYVSGSSKEVAKDGVRKFAQWDGMTWRNLGFTQQGYHMAVYQDKLYLSFGDRLATWDNNSLTYLDLPLDINITHLESANGLLFVRGASNEACVNSTENVWVRNCSATGYLLQFDGVSWSEMIQHDTDDCLNIGSINWDYHIWYNIQPDFQWDMMTGNFKRLYTLCGYFENGSFNEFSYPFEKIYSLDLVGGNSLYISGTSQKELGYSGVMMWDENQWFSLGAGIEGQVRTVEQYQGKIYVGGRFTHSIDESTKNFIVWDQL